MVLPRTRVVMRGYWIALFDPAASIEVHHAMRKDAEQMEFWTMQAFEKAEKHLMNNKRGVRLKECPRPDILNRIKKEFGLS